MTMKRGSLARSMTSGARSIGARSDWNGSSANGDADEDDEDDERPSLATNGRTWSIYKEDGGAPPPQEDLEDDPINRYVQDQLTRLKSGESGLDDEVEAQADGAHDI